MAIRQVFVSTSRRSTEARSSVPEVCPGSLD